MTLSSAALPWVDRWVPTTETTRCALDLACGHGRHTRLLLDRGYHVVAVDRDPQLGELAEHERLEIVTADLELRPWPLPGREFDVAVVTNYLHRPLLPTLVYSLSVGGRLVYQTFARGHEHLGRPRNPCFLLRENELLDVARAGGLDVLAFEQTKIDGPALVQRICAERPESRP